MKLHGCTCGLLMILLSPYFAAAQETAAADKLKADAEAAYKQGDFAKCLEMTTRILAQNPKDHGAMYLRASSHVELGVVRRDLKEVRQGIEDARESLRIGGSGEINYYLPYLYGMTALANLEGRKEHAEVAIQIAKGVLDRPKLTAEQKANILYQRAAAHIHMRNIEAAIQDYQEAIKSFPEHLGAHVGLAESYVVSQQPDKALAAFTAAVQSFPNNPLVFNNRGLFQQQQNRLNEALADFNRALQIDPKFAVAFTNRGFTQQAAGNHAAAEIDYSEAIKLEPGNPLFVSLRGTCRLAQGNTAGAIEDYNQSIRLAPQNSVAHADLGFAKYFAKDFAGALSSFDQAVTLDGSKRYLNPWRCWVMILMGSADKTTAMVDISVKKLEAERDWIDQLVLFIGGKISEQDLVNTVNKVTDANLKNAQLCEAYYFIAERRAHSGDKDNATAFYRETLKTKAAQLSAYRGAQYTLKSFGPPK